MRDYTRENIESEPYSPAIVDDLINGFNDWRSVQDIVKLTFKALSDIVKSQGRTLKDLELEIPTKASKLEMAQCMSLKSSYNETLRSINEIKSALENKVSNDDISALLQDKVNKSDLVYLLQNKTDYNEFRNSLSEKADIRDVQSEIRALRCTIEELSQDFYQKIQQCSTNRDIQHLQSLIESNSSANESILEEKANKQSVANALHRKANKSDMESMLSTKIDTQDFNKALESIEEIKASLRLKAEKNEVNQAFNEISNKLEKSEFDTVIDSVHLLRKESENKVFSHLSHLEGFVSSIKSDLEDFQSTTAVFLSKKADVIDLNTLFESLNKKVNIEETNSLISSLKQDISDQNQSIRYDFHKYQDFTNERLLKTEQCCKVIQDEISRIHENIRNFNDKARENIEEGIKSVHGFVSNKFDDIRLLRLDIEKMNENFQDLRLLKVDRTEFRKGLDSKTDPKDVQDCIDRLNRDWNRQISHVTDEIKDFVLRKEKEMVLVIDSKPGVHEINSLILENNLNKLKKYQYEDQPNENLYTPTLGNKY